MKASPSGVVIVHVEEAALSMTPAATEIPAGGTLNAVAGAANNTHMARSYRFVSMVTLPNGKTFPRSGFLIGPLAVPLTPFQSRGGNISHRVPSAAPAGSYRYRAFLVDSRRRVVAADSFDFTVTK